MSKIMSPAELKAHIKQAIQDVKGLLEDWANSVPSSPHAAKETADATHNKKRAQLLAFWLRTYSKLLRRESAFNPKSLPRLKRRQIVNVDFGFRIGSELGGLHYAVVLDIKNDYKSPTVVVVPLGSQKDGFVPNKKRIVLQDGVYAALNNKVLQWQKEGKDYSALKDKMEKLKKGTVANISQVTTISKMRIKEPIKTADLLLDVKLSARDMEQIEMALLNLYISKGSIKSAAAPSATK